MVTYTDWKFIQLLPKLKQIRDSNGCEWPEKKRLVHGHTIAPPKIIINEGVWMDGGGCNEEDFVVLSFLTDRRATECYEKMLSNLEKGGFTLISPCMWTQFVSKDGIFDVVYAPLDDGYMAGELVDVI